MRKIITFTAASLLMASAFAAGEVYRWKGPDGVWHYSDQPRPGAELVRGSTGALPRAPEAPPPAPVVDEPPAQQPANVDEPLPVSEEVAAEVRAQADAIRAEQCKAAEAAYQEALKARRIYRLDDKGNRIYMTDAEADQARLQARANRDLACGTGN
jgi:hypothetical protein